MLRIGQMCENRQDLDVIGQKYENMFLKIAFDGLVGQTLTDLLYKQSSLLKLFQPVIQRCLSTRFLCKSAFKLNLVQFCLI